MQMGANTLTLTLTLTRTRTRTRTLTLTLTLTLGDRLEREAQSEREAQRGRSGRNIARGGIARGLRGALHFKLAARARKERCARRAVCYLVITPLGALRQVRHEPSVLAAGYSLLTYYLH